MLEFIKSIGLGEILLAAIMLVVAVLAITLIAGSVAYAFVFERDPDDIEFRGGSSAPPHPSDTAQPGPAATA
jgi:hypothetical protein